MRYLTAGSGAETIIFVHGNLASSNWWEKTMPLLPAEQYQMFAVDLWRERDQQASFAVPELTASLSEWIANLDGGPVHLVGHSLGGIVCLMHALQNPSTLRTLTLVNPVPAGGMTFPEETYAVLQMMRSNRALMRQGTCNSMPLAEQDVYFERLVDDAMSSPAACFDALPRSLSTMDVSDRLSGLHMPVLLTWGELDPIIPYEPLVRMQRRIESSKLHIFKGIGHSPQIEKPDEFAELLLSHLQSVPSQSVETKGVGRPSSSEPLPMRKSYGRNGISLSYEIAGEGHPLLLIPGLGCGMWSWYKQVPFFQQSFRTITVNLRGHENWTAESPAFTIPDIADDLALLLESLGIHSSHVLGFSMGGYVAQDFAARHPHLTARLVLQSTAFLGPSAVPITREAIEFFAAFGTTPLEDYIAWGTKMRFSGEYIREHADEVTRFTVLLNKNRITLEGFRAQSAAIHAFQNETSLGRIRASTLVITGTGDRVIPYENSRLLAERIPSAQLHLFPGSGHWLNVEREQEYNAMVREFLLDQR